MTSRNPVHILPQSYRSREAVDYETPGSRRLPQLPVPDLRFERSYLKSIGRYIHKIDRNSASSSNVPKASTEQKDEKEEGMEDEALVGRIDEPQAGNVYSVEWGKVGYVTVRDQVIMPLVQGLVWGVASFYLRPLFSSFMEAIRATNSNSPSFPRKADNNIGINKLRKWVNGIVGGLQANAALSR